MSTRIRFVLVLAAFTGAQCSAARVGNAKVDAATTGQTPQILCSISTLDGNWRMEGDTSSVIVEIRSEAPTTVTGLLSLHLSPLPKQDDLGGGYWAPFDVNGRSTSSRQAIQPSGGRSTSIRLLPARLHWAPTKSSVWPAREFVRVVPPGRYTARVRIEVEKGTDISSNEVPVTVVAGAAR